MSLIHHRWLDEQLPAWEREGIVTTDGARKLRERYPAEPQGGLAQLVVGAVGALLIGTGLIAVLAFNWDDFPRWVRLVLALGPLAVTQAVSWWVLGRGESAKPWQREAAALVQTLAVGAAMALVSQIYNLPGKWTDFSGPAGRHPPALARARTSRPACAGLQARAGRFDPDRAPRRGGLRHRPTRAHVPFVLRVSLACDALGGGRAPLPTRPRRDRRAAVQAPSSCRSFSAHQSWSRSRLHSPRRIALSRSLSRWRSRSSSTRIISTSPSSRTT